MITFGSVCAGIGGFDRGLEKAGMVCKWQIEINKACQTVLRKHFPNAALYDDLTDQKTQEGLEHVNVLAGGTPCQGFSIAGMRKGIADDRSNLCLQFVKLADRVRADIIVWENVPGVLCLADNSFGCFLGALVGSDTPLVHPDTEPFRQWWRKSKGGERFHSWPRAGLVAGPLRKAAWRVLDSQYFGVAQRRDRLFVVADSGDGSCAQILFEPEMLRRHSPPSRTEEEDLAVPLRAGSETSGFGVDIDGNTFIPQVVGALSDGAHRGGGLNGQDVYSGRVIATTRNVANAIQEREGKGADSLCTQTFVIGFDKSRCDAASEVAGTLRTNSGKAKGVNAGKADNQCVAFHAQQDPIVSNDTAPCLGPGGSKSGQASLAVAFQPGGITRSKGTLPSIEHTPPLMSENDGYTRQCVAQVKEPMCVRRLTPTECERLQGFPDGWTKGQKDSPRYKQLGNAVTTVVAEWIGHRITEAWNRKQT